MISANDILDMTFSPLVWVVSLHMLMHLTNNHRRVSSQEQGLHSGDNCGVLQMVLHPQHTVKLRAPNAVGVLGFCSHGKSSHPVGRSRVVEYGINKLYPCSHNNMNTLFALVHFVVAGFVYFCSFFFGVINADSCSSGHVPPLPETEYPD